jgi:hypothetical protein
MAAARRRETFLAIAVDQHTQEHSMEAERTSEIARHWVNGEWVSSTKISESLNPSTGQVLGRFADGGAEEAKRLARRLWKADHR